MRLKQIGSMKFKNPDVLYIDLHELYMNFTDPDVLSLHLPELYDHETEWVAVLSYK